MRNTIPKTGGSSGHSAGQRAHGRPYFYGYGKDDIINAYTPEEWGLGGSSAYSSNNPAHSLVVLTLIEVLLTVPAILAPIWMIIGGYLPEYRSLSAVPCLHGPLHGRLVLHAGLNPRRTSGTKATADAWTSQAFVPSHG